MPVRSSSSSVLRWPERTRVEQEVRAWAAREAPRHGELLRLGMFGSYARADAGVGSDLDLIAIVRESAVPFDRRSLAWDLLSLPLPAELLVYTEAEWAEMTAAGGRFPRTVERETIWLVGDRS